MVVHSSAWAEGFFNDAKVDLTLKNFYQNRNFLGNNVAHAQPVGDWALGINIGVFFGKEDGSARAGDLNNKTFTGLFFCQLRCAVQHFKRPERCLEKCQRPSQLA